MNPGAGVTSIEVLTDWHVALSTFRTDAQNALASLSLGLQRATDWLLQQQQHWKRAIREAEVVISQAKEELHQRQWQDFLGHKPDTTVQEENLRHARSQLQYAEERLENVHLWLQRLPQAIRDIYEDLRNLTFFLEIELARGLAMLARQLTALEQYAATQIRHSSDRTSVYPQNNKGADMILDGGRSALYSSIKNLQAQWDATERYWQDTMRQQFIEQIWMPLEEETAKTLEAVDQLAAVLNQMRRDCEASSYDIYQED